MIAAVVIFQIATGIAGRKSKERYLWGKFEVGGNCLNEKCGNSG
jgi:hypothetical protein